MGSHERVYAHTCLFLTTGWALNIFKGIWKLESGFYPGSNEKTVPQKKEASLKESCTDT